LFFFVAFLVGSILLIFLLFCLVFVLCVMFPMLSVSCSQCCLCHVPNVVCVSGLSILHCSFQFSLTFIYTYREISMFTGNQEIIFTREEWGLSINFKLIFRLEIIFVREGWGLNINFKVIFRLCPLLQVIFNYFLSS
jgi:hypothetical protein